MDGFRVEQYPFPPKTFLNVYFFNEKSFVECMVHKGGQNFGNFFETPSQLVTHMEELISFFSFSG